MFDLLHHNVLQAAKARPLLLTLFSSAYFAKGRVIEPTFPSRAMISFIGSQVMVAAHH